MATSKLRVKTGTLTTIYRPMEGYALRLQTGSDTVSLDLDESAVLGLIVALKELAKLNPGDAGFSTFLKEFGDLGLNYAPALKPETPIVMVRGGR